MEFVTKRFPMFNGAISEKDIDGIDSKEEYVTENTKNVDFFRGFFRACASPQLVQLPVALSYYLSEGYEILTGKYFYHSTQGHVFFYCMYKLDGTNHYLKFIVNGVEISIDEQNGDVTVAEKPTNINYNLVNDQLKINLNCTGTYNAISRGVTLNLTLIYRDYTSGTKYYDYTKADGWFLFPRWIGWTYNVLNSITLLSGTPDDEMMHEDCEDATYIHNMTIADLSQTTDTYGNGVLVTDTPAAIMTGTITITDVFNVKRIVIEATADVTGSVEVRFNGYISVQEFSAHNPVAYDTLIFDVNMLSNGSSDLIIKLNNTTASGFAVINDIKIYSYGHEDLVLIGKTFDLQRGVVHNPVNDIGIYGELDIYIKDYCIDWRITHYELYAKDSEDSIFYLVADIPVDKEVSPYDWKDGTATIVDTWYRKIEFEMTTTTLNFNYGLGSTVRVDGDPTIRRPIYSEVTYKGRTYYVKSDYKVYYSHIAGSGSIQPDSFPYDESVKFGYFEVNMSELNRGLSVSPLEELVVKTDKRNYIYYIQYSSGTAYRTLKAVNGGVGVTSVQGIMKSLNGIPDAEILMWYDNNGIYAYAGGREAPKNVVLSNQRYWTKLSTALKNSGIGFYLKIRNEYWICLGTMIYIYSIDYGTFKEYSYPIAVKAFIGIRNDIIYFIGVDNNIYSVDVMSETYLNAILETHYTTCLVKAQDSNDYTPYPSPPYLDKILQELYMQFHTPATGVVTVEIIIDGIEISPMLNLNSYRMLDSILTPLLIRYKKIKLRIYLFNNVEVSEVGFTYSIKHDGKATNLPGVIKGIGMESGGTSGVVL